MTIATDMATALDARHASPVRPIRRPCWRMCRGNLHALAAATGLKELPTSFLGLAIQQDDNIRGWELASV